MATTIPATTSTIPITTTTIPIVSQFSPSANWSGYVYPSNSIITEASAQWTVPTLNCLDTPNGQSGTWVGLGGYAWVTGGNSGTLLQTGTINNCVNGVQQESAFFEIFPSSPNYSEHFANFPIGVGDTISAEIGQTSSGSWATFVEDLTTGLEGVFGVGLGWEVETISGHTVIGGLQGVATGTFYSGAYTAEWIMEDPENPLSSSLYPMANYGIQSFSNLETSLPSWSLPSNDGYEIEQNGVTLSAPSVVIGNGFTTTYTGP